jgi:DNA modification methylase
MTKSRLYVGDTTSRLRRLKPESIQCVVTSPPYWGLRDYGVADQIGCESSPEEYVERLVAVFREVRRSLTSNGTTWLVLGDSYANPDKGSYQHSRVKAEDSLQKGNLASDFYGASNRNWNGLAPKNLVGIPWRVAFALQADGWYLRSEIIWHKPNPMPESVRDRPTKAHEQVFLLTKSKRYYYDADAVREPATNRPAGNKTHKGKTAYEQGDQRHRTKVGLVNTKPTAWRNRRSVWTVATQPFPEAHFAVFPERLVEPCVLAGSREGDLILDPFCGAGTVGVVAKRLSRHFIGIDLKPDYIEMARRRIAKVHRKEST